MTAVWPSLSHRVLGCVLGMALVKTMNYIFACLSQVAVDHLAFARVSIDSCANYVKYTHHALWTLCPWFTWPTVAVIRPSAVRRGFGRDLNYILIPPIFACRLGRCSFAQAVPDICKDQE